MLYVRDMFSRNFSGFLLKIREFVQMCYSIGTEKCWVLAIIKKHHLKALNRIQNKVAEGIGTTGTQISV